MGIADQFQEVFVAIHDNRFVPSLKKVAGAVLPPVYPAGIAEGKVLHDFGEGLVRHLDDEVHMVCHQAEGMNSMSEALSPFLQQKIEPVPVGVIEKNVLSRISTQDNVIICAGIMNTRFSCH